MFHCWRQEGRLVWTAFRLRKNYLLCDKHLVRTLTRKENQHSVSSSVHGVILNEQPAHPHSILRGISLFSNKNNLSAVGLSCLSVNNNCINDHASRHFSTSPSYQQDSIPRSRALTLIKELKEVKHSPAPALLLGLSGLVPFISAPVYMILTQAFSPMIAYAQIAYGATILSFLGGVRWGMTLPEDSVVRPDWTNLGYSVTPSLVAWVGLLLPEPLAIFTLMGGLGIAAYFDTTMYGYPLWFKGLRFVLSFVAVLSLWTTFMYGYIISDRKDIKNEKDAKSQTTTNETN